METVETYRKLVQHLLQAHANEEGGAEGVEVQLVFDTAHDQACLGAWPPDIDNDTFSDISDLIYLTGNFGVAVPPAPRRHNIGLPVDGFLDITDISRLLFFFGKGCGV